MWAMAAAMAATAALGSIQEAPQWEIPYSLVAEAVPEGIVVLEELVAMHLMVPDLLAQAEVAEAEALGLMRAIHLLTATDRLLEEVLVSME